MNRKEFLLITVGIFLTIIAWVTIDVYHIRTTKNEVGIKPVSLLNYDINVKVINTLMEKKP